MHLFSVKSIGLYSLAIGGAIVFFNFITSYGEANLRAPTSIAGTYLISAHDLPECLQDPQLLLKLQQSGIYLNASLIIDRSKSTNIDSSHPTLSGKLVDRQLNLVGNTPSEICPQLSQLKIVGAVLPTNKINQNEPIQVSGQLSIDSLGKTNTQLVKLSSIKKPSTQSTSAH